MNQSWRTSEGTTQEVRRIDVGAVLAHAKMKREPCRRYSSSCDDAIPDNNIHGEHARITGPQTPRVVDRDISRAPDRAGEDNDAR